MVMDRTTLGRAIRPLERDKLLAIGEGEDSRTRSLRLTPTGEARLKAATAKWREAQKKFELTFGAQDAAQLRNVLQRVVSVN
jgi:DNA-binding MarR family transcriptional regulator